MRLAAGGISLLLALSLCHGALASHIESPLPTDTTTITTDTASTSTRKETADDSLLHFDQLYYLQRVRTLSAKLAAEPKCWQRHPLSHFCRPYNASLDWEDECYCEIYEQDGPLEGVYFCCNFFGYEANIGSNVFLPFREISLTNSSLLDLMVNSHHVESIHIDSVNIQRIKTGTELVLQTAHLRDSITISHQKDVSILGGNYIIVQLFNVTGCYLAYNTLQDDFKKPNSSHLGAISRSLLVEESNLTTVFSKGFTEVVFKGSSTHVQFIDIGEVEHFWSRNLQVNNFEELIFKRRTSTDEFIFSEGSIKNILRIVLYSNALLQLSTFEKIHSLIIDHEEDYKKRTIIKGCAVTDVNGEGIRIKRGYVELDSVSFKKFAPNMIYMTGTSKLFLRRMSKKLLDCGSGTDVVKAISVQRLSQVVYDGRTTPDWLLECLEIRPMKYQQKMLENYHVLDPGECTTKIPRTTLRCLFTNKIQPEKPIQLGYHPGLDQYTSVHLTGLKNLVIGENCFTEIKLIDTYCSLVEAADDSCYSHMGLYNSRLEILPGNVWKVMIKKSFVRLISPSSPVEVVYAESSEIGGISLVGSVLFFQNVTFHNIQKMIVSSSLSLINCTIEQIDSLNIHIVESAQAEFINTTIKRLASEAIRVDGELSMSNVTIEQGDQTGIKNSTPTNIHFSNTKFHSVDEPLNTLITNDLDQMFEESEIFKKFDSDMILTKAGQEDCVEECLGETDHKGTEGITKEENSAVDLDDSETIRQHKNRQYNVHQQIMNKPDTIDGNDDWAEDSSNTYDNKLDTIEGNDDWAEDSSNTDDYSPANATKSFITFTIVAACAVVILIVLYCYRKRTGRVCNAQGNEDATSPLLPPSANDGSSPRLASVPPTDAQAARLLNDPREDATTSADVQTLSQRRRSVASSSPAVVSPFRLQPPRKAKNRGGFNSSSPASR